MYQVFSVIFAALAIFALCVGWLAMIMHIKAPDQWLVRFSIACDVMAIFLAVLAGAVFKHI